MRPLLFTCAGAVVLAGGVAAQTTDVVVEAVPAMSRRVAVAGVAGAPANATFEFVSNEMGIEGQIVKAAPYSAEAVTENIQVLADGNRISRKNSTTLYRDGEGRTRREVSLSTIGPWATSGEATKLIMIYDPVAEVSYTLDEKTKTARKIAGKGMAFAYATTTDAPVAGARMAAPPHVAHAMTTTQAAAPIAFARSSDSKTAKTESLGKQNIEGVVAEGTRVINTIPAGEIGNERAIEIVSERWFSPELQAMVMTRHTNPMSGESTYKLTNIRRGEPAKTLFEVPADYTLKNEEMLPALRLRKGPGE